MITQKQVHENARSKGWWPDLTDKPDTADIIVKLALISCEVSEAIEDVRNDRMAMFCEESGKPNGFPAELADIVIRTMDLAEAMGIDLNGMIKLKHEYNRKRPHRHGGKKA